MKRKLPILAILFFILFNSSISFSQTPVNYYDFTFKEQQYRISYLSLINNKQLILSNVKGEKLSVTDLLYIDEKTLEKSILTLFIQSKFTIANATDSIELKVVEKPLLLLINEYEKHLAIPSTEERAGDLIFARKIRQSSKVEQKMRYDTLKSRISALNDSIFKLDSFPDDVVKKRRLNKIGVPDTLNGFYKHVNNSLFLIDKIQIFNLKKVEKKLRKSKKHYHKWDQNKYSGISLKTAVGHRKATFRKIAKANNKIYKRGDLSQLVVKGNNTNENLKQIINLNEKKLKDSLGLKISMALTSNQFKGSVQQPLNSAINRILLEYSNKLLNIRFNKTLQLDSLDTVVNDSVISLITEPLLDSTFVFFIKTSIDSIPISTVTRDSVIISKIKSFLLTYPSRLIEIKKGRVGYNIAKEDLEKRLKELNDTLKLAEITEELSNKIIQEFTSIIGNSINNVNNIEKNSSLAGTIMNTAKLNILYPSSSLYPSLPILIKPETVDVQFEGGAINKIYVRVQDSISKEWIEFYNWRPIPFKTIDDFTNINREILYAHSRPDYPGYILLRDVLHFMPNLAIKANDYSPKDGQIINRRTNYRESVPLSKWGLNNYLNIKAYSDLAGISNESPNGLIQFESSFTKIINSRNLGQSQWTPVREISVDFNFTKIEEDQRYMTKYGRLGDQSNERYFRTIDYVQFSRYNTGVNLNLIKFSSRRSIVDFYLNVRTGIFLTNFSDSIRTISQDSSIKVVPETSRVFAGFLSPEALAKFRSGSNLGLDISFKLLGVKVYNEKYIQGRGNSALPFQPLKSLFDPMILNPSFTAYYNPLSDINNRFFFRASWFKSWTNKGNFAQIQVGYSATFSNIFSGKTKTNAELAKDFN